MLFYLFASLKSLMLHCSENDCFTLLCLRQINILSSARLYMSKDLLPLEVRENTLKQVSEFLSRKPSGLPLDPEGDMNVFPISFLLFIFSFTLLWFTYIRNSILTTFLLFFRFKAAHTKRQYVGQRLQSTCLKNMKLQNLHLSRKSSKSYTRSKN